MSRGVVFGARFTVEVWDDDRLVQRVVRHNRILRRGLFAIVSHGYLPSQFDTFTVGYGAAPESSALPGLDAPFADGYVPGTYTSLDFPQWGYTAVYEPGVATGEWTEIGMCLPGHEFTLNRARFTNLAGAYAPVVKAALYRATVNVAFTMSRN